MIYKFDKKLPLCQPSFWRHNNLWRYGKRDLQGKTVFFFSLVRLRLRKPNKLNNSDPLKMRVLVPLFHPPHYHASFAPFSKQMELTKTAVKLNLDNFMPFWSVQWLRKGLYKYHSERAQDCKLEAGKWKISKGDRE